MNNKQIQTYNRMIGLLHHCMNYCKLILILYITWTILSRWSWDRKCVKNRRQEPHFYDTETRRMFEMYCTLPYVRQPSRRMLGKKKKIFNSSIFSLQQYSSLINVDLDLDFDRATFAPKRCLYLFVFFKDWYQ